VVTKANGVLELLAAIIVISICNPLARDQEYIHSLSGAAVNVVVMAALALVESLLGSALLVVGLETAGDTVGGISEALLDLVLGGLGGVRSELLLGLCTGVLVSKSA
jgi:hypothetical protein